MREMFSLLDEYRRHASDHGAHTLDGDAEATNRSYDLLRGVFDAMARGGTRDDLFSLYDDVNLWVQCWSAAHTLEIDEARALSKLEVLAVSGVPHVATDARYTINEWKSGRLRFVDAGK